MGVAPPTGVAPPVAPPVGPPGTTAATSSGLPAGVAASRAAMIAPYLDDQTIAIMRVDLTNLKVDESLSEMTNPDRRAPGVTDEQVEHARTFAQKIKDFQSLAQEMYIVVSLSDVPVYPPFTVVKMQSGADPKKIFALTESFDINAMVDEKKFQDGTLVQADIMVIGNARTIYRLRSPSPATVPNLEQALEFAGDAPLQAIFVPTDSARETLGRLIPTIPPEYSIDGPAIASGIKYAVATLKPAPGFEMRVEAQGASADTAQRVHTAVGKGFEKMREVITDPIQQFILSSFMPQLTADRLTFSLKEGDPLYKKLESAALKEFANAGGRPSLPTFGLGGLTPPGPGGEPMPMPMPGDPSSIPLDPNGQPISNDPPFIAAAKKAFAEGRESEGMQFLYAEALAGEDKDNLKDGLRWAPGLKRPTLAIRWGVGIQYNAPRNFSSGPAPIGRPQSGAPQQSGNQQGGDPNMPKFDAPPMTVLDYFAAELGPKVVEGLRTRVDIGQFGDVLLKYRDATTSPQSSPSSTPDATKSPVFKPLAAAPGITFLGVEKGGTIGLKELVATAKKEGVDALIVYDIAVVPGRSFVTNNTKLLLYDINKAEPLLHTSKILKNTAVELARQDGDDPVEDVMEKLMTAVDETFILADLPEALNEANVTARVNKLAETPPDNKLPLLVEIAFWQKRGLLSPENATIANEKILGPDGAKLAGTPEERMAVVMKLLPKSALKSVPKRVGIGLPER